MLVRDPTGMEVEGEHGDPWNWRNVRAHCREGIWDGDTDRFPRARILLQVFDTNGADTLPPFLTVEIASASLYLCHL